MQNPETRDWLLRVRVPSDPRFVETVRDLAGRIADRTHYTPREAMEIGQAVEWATVYAVKTSAGCNRDVDVRFATRNGLLEITVCFAEPHPGPAGPLWLDEDEQQGRDRLSRLMDRVEFDHEADLMVCRMMRRLP